MVQGMASLNRKLRRTIPARVRTLTRSALVVWADKIVASMKAFAPKRSGALIESIGWVWGAEAPKGTISVGTVRGGDPDFTITVFAGGKDAFWARWVEFGTQPHATVKNASVLRGHRQGQGTQHPGTTPQPFFFPAVRLNRRGGRSRVSRAIKRGIQEGAR